MTYNEMVKSYQEKMKEFKKEDMCRSVRLRVLYEQLYDLEEELYERQKSYKESLESNGPYIERALIGEPIPIILSDIKRLTMSIRLLCSDYNNSITPEMILSARNHPIEDIISVNRSKFAKCVNHEDSNPSMFTKGNFGYCFVCGYTGDCIDIYSRINNTDFRSSVMALQ